MPYYVYFMTNRPQGTLYIGVTNDIVRRATEHREGLVEGFTKRHGLKHLVYLEVHDDPRTAIQREKTMKHWRRSWKIELVENDNPGWEDLYPQITR